ncbi:MAG TPA: cytochrome c oxidase subunit 3 [Ktedonobacterales bacterium]|jgi:heme/copper-type cytochrome/quinol oxidase subunit 3|nr:cytochrome c oxidase subunit 3 [Ktedonobacterales bacterium]
MEISLGEHGHDVSAHASHIDEEGKVRLGMLFYVIVDVMFALFLVTAYIFLRGVNVNDQWFPAGTKNIDLVQPTIQTGLMVASGLFFILAHWAVRAGMGALVKLGVTVGAILWIVTLIGNIQYMGHLPFTQSGGGFASMYVLFTGYHIYHLLLGLMFVIGVTVRSLQGRYTQEHHLGITTIGYYWYWTVLFGVIGYLLPIMLPGPLH